MNVLTLLRSPFYTALGVAFALLPALAVDATGQIHDLELEVVESPALGGETFGASGAYERLRGVAYGVVDPDDPRHADIVNLRRAPTNEQGLVEYSTTVEIYRPIDMSRWNRAIYHTVPNRGGAGAAEPALLEMGFALVRVGWQGDIEPTPTNIVAHLPIARNPDGSPVVGPAMEEFIFNDDDPVSDARLTYASEYRDPALASLTVRARQTDPRQTPVDLAWSYAGLDEIRISRPSGFNAGAIYEFIYRAQDPIVLGLGFAAVRDVISFFRYEDTDADGTPNPLARDGLPEWALSIGVSQSGRFLRDLLYQGFNEDLEGRIVFDGMHPNIAGSRKTFTNYEFGQPGRWQKQHEDHLYPGDQFPFTYPTLTDTISGRTDGLLERCAASDTCPRIVHSDGEAEIWQARSSLVVTDPSGAHVEQPDNVRVYLISGTQHGGGPGVHRSNPSPGICQNPRNPLALDQIRLALSVALYRWVAEGVEPPESRFPSANDGGLVPAEELAFPEIPGVRYTASYNPLRLRRFDALPPTSGEAYPVLVGRVDLDGNMTDGILHPNLAAPLGTFTGWNLRAEGFAEGEQCAGSGSFVPFAATRAEREASGDPRLSLEERYGTPEGYSQAVSAAASELVEERLLLPRDAEEIVRLARESAGW